MQGREDAMLARPVEFGPWNPGIESQVPKELRHLATIFRAENVFTSLAAAGELRGLTGFNLSELVVFRPQRLALHELLVRITADFAVPDGTRIADLGLNFREIARLLLSRYLEPAMDSITAAYRRAERDVNEVIEPAVSHLGRNWGPQEIAEFEKLPPGRLGLLGSLGRRGAERCGIQEPGARAVGIIHEPRSGVGHEGSDRFNGRRDRQQRFRQRLHRSSDRAAAAYGRARARIQAPAASGTSRRDQHQGPLGLGQEHIAAAAEEARRRHRRAVERFRADQSRHLAQTAAGLRLSWDRL